MLFLDNGSLVRLHGGFVSESEIEAAYRDADFGLVEILKAAADNIRRFHESHRETSWFIEDGDGVSLGKRVLPIDRAAILIPGASAPLFSTLLMGVIPAQIAGVPHLCVATPPREDGSVHPVVLAAAHILGLNEKQRNKIVKNLSGVLEKSRKL